MKQQKMFRIGILFQQKRRARALFPFQCELRNSNHLHSHRRRRGGLRTQWVFAQPLRRGAGPPPSPRGQRRQSRAPSPRPDSSTLQEYRERLFRNTTHRRLFAPMAKPAQKRCIGAATSCPPKTRAFASQKNCKIWTQSHPLCWLRRSQAKHRILGGKRARFLPGVRQCVIFRNELLNNWHDSNKFDDGLDLCFSVETSAKMTEISTRLTSPKLFLDRAQKRVTCQKARSEQDPHTCIASPFCSTTLVQLCLHQNWTHISTFNSRCKIPYLCWWCYYCPMKAWFSLSLQRRRGPLCPASSTRFPQKWVSSQMNSQQQSTRSLPTHTLHSQETETPPKLALRSNSPRLSQPVSWPLSCCRNEWLFSLLFRF